MRAILLAIALAAVPAASCTTMGDPFTLADVASLQPGLSTRADAERLLGRPMSITNLADGTTLLQWVHIQTVYVSSDSTHVALLFDRNGRFLRVFQQTQTSTF